MSFNPPPPPAQFSLDRVANDCAHGDNRGFEFFIDAAHNDKPDHVDLSVFMNDGSTKKYSGLAGVEELREQMPWLQDNQEFGTGR